MGRYLNSSTSYVLYKGQTEQPYFVDKSQMLSELFPFLDSGNTHICITRPRRFGKTVMANMITAFLGKKQDSDSIFKSLKISQNDLYSKYRNQYNVISIDFSKMPRDCDSYTDYIDRIETNLIRDLRKEYPQIEIYEDDSAADVLETIFEECDQQRFVFVLDEWDFIFHKDFVTEENKKQYVLFLSNLLKDRSYVQLTYMTGILPVKKYGTHSALNMFIEYSMTDPGNMAEYFGFAEREVESLCVEYGMSIEETKAWYNGYGLYSHNKQEDILYSIYNPKSVVEAMLRHRFGNYWNQTETYEALKIYIQMNMDGLKDAIIEMLAGNSVRINIGTFHNDMTTFATRDDILTLLVHLGYLTYDVEKESVRIPNKEVAQEYINAISTMDWKEAISQIKDKKYALKFQGKLEEQPKYTGRILAVGIGYDKQTKEHSCKVEVLE